MISNHDKSIASGTWVSSAATVCEDVEVVSVHDD